MHQPPATHAMTTSFVKQQIDMSTNDIMYQVSQQQVDIVILMVLNEVQHQRIEGHASHF